MKKTLITLSLCCFSVFSSAKSSEPLVDYGNNAHETVKLIEASSYHNIGKSAANLVELAKQILPKFAEQHQTCEVYLNAVMLAADSMQQLSLEAIELDYHRDQKLPPLSSGDCYHAKDLLVHPATVVVMARTLKDTQANREHMKHEIDEVIEHLGLVKAAVK